MVGFTHIDKLCYIPKRNASDIITRGKREKKRAWKRIMMHMDFVVPKAEHRNQRFWETTPLQKGGIFNVYNVVQHYNVSE